MLDIAIIGAGPAGLSAAITGKIRNKKVKVFG
ncbi:MAG: FAD-binding protein, partial [Cellulosilyticum sp.]|nr:FAD-binding protein [Cellulosilyticum sp.]